MGFDFVSYGGGDYHEVPSLADAIPLGHGLYSNFVQDGMYWKREHLGGIYTSLAHTRNFDGAVKEFIREKASTKHVQKPRFDFALDVPKLDFFYRTAQFRGDSSRTRIELVYGVPLKQFDPASQKDSTVTFTFQTDFVLDIFI